MRRMAEAFVWFWVRRAMRSRFFSIQMRGAEVLRGLKGPAVIFANHSGWWDTFLCFFLKRQFALKAYGMMEEKNLRKASFLKWIGVFGIDLESPRGAVVGLREARRLLREGGVIFMFPQGRHSPFHCRPVEFRPGLEWLAAKCPEARLVALAVRYEMLWESRPQIFLDVAEAGAAEPEEWPARLEAGMDRLNAAVCAQDFAGFEPLLAPTPSVNKRWEQVRACFTGKKVDPFNT